jgi:L-iditol 2-dehydrogenase
LCRGKDGAYADYLTMPVRHTYRIPDEVDFEEASLTEATATVVRAVRKARLQPGAVCVIIGDGPIGLLGLQAASACGAGQTILTGTFNKKLDVGKEVGADITINAARQDVVEAINELTGGVGADFVMEVSGNVEAMKQAVTITRMGGTVSVVGLYETPIPDFDMGDVVVRDIDLITSVASPNSFRETLKLMASKKIRTKPLISHRFPLSQAAEAFDVQINRQADRCKILLAPES